MLAIIITIIIVVQAISTWSTGSHLPQYHMGQGKGIGTY